MNEQFYIAIDGQQTGPFSIEELKAKGINQDTLVWTTNLDNWTKAGYIPLLKDILQPIPPPLPIEEKQEEIPPVEIETETPKPRGKYFGYQLAGRTERLVAFMVNHLLIWIPLCIIPGGGMLTFSSYDYDYSSLLFDILIAAIFGAVFYPMWSGNLGHKIMGIKVISSIDGSDQKTAVDGAKREVLKSVFSIVFLPVIWLLWDDDKQNLYDKVIDTYVVKKNSNKYF